MHILVTGATGYIGGRLIPRLLEAEHSVRVLVRDRKRIIGRPWEGKVEIFEGDLLKPSTLEAALKDIDVAYYLVHSMISSTDFQSADNQAALNFAKNAKDLKHLIYLGGVLPETGRVSKHLASRAKVGEILREHLPTTEFRAGPIIGSGSASFEMVRYLTERLPIMFVPSWVLHKVQPIAVRDVLKYLLLALNRGPLGIVNIGAGSMTFKEMLEIYAQVCELRRLIIPLPPVFSRKLTASWISFVTPIPLSLAEPLVEGIEAPLINDLRPSRILFSEIKPISYAQAVALAMQRTLDNAIETRWSGASGGKSAYQLTDWEGLNKEVRTIHVKCSPECVFKVFTSLGGKRGWLVWELAWSLRGILDLLVGGPGLRRGRRDPNELLPGEAVDFWRVEAVEAPNLLRLQAEMKVPGHAWLQWETAKEESGTRLIQTALFAPRGLFGTLYWYLLYPLHTLIFTHLVRAIAKEALELDKQQAQANKLRQ